MDVSLDDLLEVHSPGLSSNTAEDRPLTLTEEKTNSVALPLLDPRRPIDPARTAIEAGAAFEATSVEKLKKMEDKSNALVASIDLLLSLSSAAGKLNADKPVLNDEMRDLLKQLKEKGIDLFPTEGKEIDKESLMALKSDIGSRMDHLRTEVQQIFTKMQTIIQNMASVNDSVKKMISEQADLVRKMLDRSIKR